MTCKCGIDLTPKAKFCPECGTPAPKPEPLKESKIEEILTTYEAAEFLKISRWKIYDLIRKKQIPFKEVGTQKRFVKARLIEWMQV
ncbi:MULTISPECIES: excisionase family DNA-binding protein [Pelosinus]|uniref:DNA binding domain protein, excisionase family n=1 Tax=Pelosinus fermentans B4 TaxID=1149862 RepID=I9LJZ5_9FIRM|nr:MULTISPECIES: excisionase family DNA-binding protein [Pelosinus]EIW20751.1 DNA binding domain protein, excisionase family [Pelosinus fermentans B4]EIW25404.1 DNA binding domain protein, excisionase family [Pelosinus fermentans A11]OAM91981.1 DNA binding domain protein, excisionase family [Pelosinus fermentans DSM 17108]OAM93662.1 DNA binding domain protein, excisionase family [Pelosinus fermentans DSM 17108]SDQ03060.1 DNA binding domain-containing protein, excisionase family [Pelosinus ferm